MIGAVFFDIQKAFDSVPHKALMAKLQQTGLNSNILVWVGNYLTCRRQTVLVKNQVHQTYLFSLSGLPQGSILGPFLFLIYIDDLTHLSISCGSHSVLYADDLLLFRSIKSQEDFHLLQSDVSIIDDGVQQNYLTLNSGDGNICFFFL